MAQDPGSRQQRRKEARRLIELGRAALARGFPEGLDDQVSIGVAMLLREKLKEPGNPERASQAAALAEQVLDRSNARYEADAKVACRRGCSHCCITVASVTPPEIFRVAGWLRRQRDLGPELAAGAVLARCRTKRGASLEEMFRQKVPCPALVNHECGVHPARPLNCRQFLSTSLEACIAKFGRDEGEVPFVPAALDRGVLARILLLGAVQSVGLNATSYELSGALETALRDAAAERRWLAGEDVFAGVLVTPRPASTQALIDRCARIVSGAA